MADKTFWLQDFVDGDSFLMEEPGSIARKKWSSDNSLDSLISTYTEAKKFAGKRAVAPIDKVKPVVVDGTPTPTPTPNPIKIIGHSWRNGGDDSKQPTVALLSNGHYLITSDGDTDADGSQRVGSIDPDSGQSHTSLRRSNGWKGQYEYVDSEAIPFFVLPMNWVKTTGDTKSHLGDMARLTYKDKTIYAIYADQGPNALIGEASICAIEKLGGNPWNANKTKIVRGIPHGVSYEIISGSADLSRTIDFDSIQKYGQELFGNVIPQPQPEPQPQPQPTNNAQKFISYFKANYLAVDKEVERWFAGVYSPDATQNACVAHQVSCLKLCGLLYPQPLGSMASINVDYFVDWALMNKWLRITDMAKLQAGDICVSGPSQTDIDHVYCFVEYIDANNAKVLHNQCVGIGNRALKGGSVGQWRFALRMPNSGVVPTPTPVPSTDFSVNFTHLKNVKADLALTNDEAITLWAAMQAQIKDKAAFNNRVNLGVKPEYGNAQCATTTASVIEGALLQAGLNLDSEYFSKPHRDKDEFALTHQVEIMLKRFGFIMYSKATHVAPCGAIGMMSNRYEFGGCSQHSGHVFSIYEDKGVGNHDVICDNGGWNHVYANDTESFFVPSGIAVAKRDGSTPVPTIKGKVCLDSGHSLHNPGARSNDGKVREEILNESAVKVIQDFLNTNNVKTIWPNPDPDSLTEVGKAGWGDISIMLSWHHNSYTGSGNPYVCCMVDPAAPQTTKLFAQKCARAIVEALKGTPEETKIFSGTHGMEGVYEAELSVINTSAKDPDGKPPKHILVEAYFLNKFADEAQCLAVTNKAALAVAKVTLSELG